MKTIAQSDLLFPAKKGKTPIIASTEYEKNAALILLKNLNRVFPEHFEISGGNRKTAVPSIHLKIEKPNPLSKDEFILESSSNEIFLIAGNEKSLRYAVYTLLETWGFRKFTAKDTYIPEVSFFSFPQQFKQLHKPSFDYRVLFYPDAYDEEFRDWHKLDWHLDDFGIWGHSFGKLIPTADYFVSNPDFFALYENNRNPESLCMTNEAVYQLAVQKIQQEIKENPEARFFSISQNDDVVFCECNDCKALNEEYGGPQGSLYHFLNRIASQFPKTDFTTLAYLHTFYPPKNLKIEPNIHTFLCPIALDRGKSIQENKNFNANLQAWSKAAPNLFVWDYTVQFSNYLAPFPNFHTFSENFKTLKENNVKGVFIQGYGDVLGDFSELRTYILAKLAWDSKTDIETTIEDFLRGFYGKAAPSIKAYLDLLTENQLKSKVYLDIYSGPVQNRNSFLTSEAMDAYDKLILQAENAVADNPLFIKRVLKLRLALEYTYFEQSKFYGKDKHGMFTITKKGQKIVSSSLTERVRQFAENCKSFDMYELSEGGVSPDEYYQEWLEISKNHETHLGENLQIELLTLPAEEFAGKGNYGLVDGAKGFKDFNINWMGWYGNNPEILLNTNQLKFKKIKLNFLEDQRHWIFKPKKASIYGFENGKWVLVEEKTLETLTDNNAIIITSLEFYYKSFSRFTKIKLNVQNHSDLPSWRKRKNKKPMVMIDEIELY